LAHRRMFSMIPVLATIKREKRVRPRVNKRRGMEETQKI